MHRVTNVAQAKHDLAKDGLHLGTGLGAWSWCGHCNDKALEAVVRGKVDEAEQWLQKLCDKSQEPLLPVFNGFLQLLANSGGSQKIEEWLIKLCAPALRPPFSILSPDGETYSIAVEACAQAGNLPRAEHWAAEAKRTSRQLNLQSYYALVDACLAQNEPRRAHQWLRAAVDSGHKKLSKKAVEVLVRSLTDTGNTNSANEWLGYMAELGLPLNASTYTHVRAAHPVEVVPLRLSGEHQFPVAPKVRPAKLRGESRLGREVDCKRLARR